MFLIRRGPHLGDGLSAVIYGHSRERTGKVAQNAAAAGLRPHRLKDNEIVRLKLGC